MLTDMDLVALTGKQWHCVRGDTLDDAMTVYFSLNMNTLNNILEFIMFRRSLQHLNLSS